MDTPPFDPDPPDPKWAPEPAPAHVCPPHPLVYLSENVIKDPELRKGIVGLLRHVADGLEAMG